jgi:hypothetical protein
MDSKMFFNKFGLELPEWMHTRTIYVLRNSFTKDELRSLTRQQVLHTPNAGKVTAREVGRLLFGDGGWPENRLRASGDGDAACP